MVRSEKALKRRQKKKQNKILSKNGGRAPSASSPGDDDELFQGAAVGDDDDDDDEEDDEDDEEEDEVVAAAPSAPSTPRAISKWCSKFMATPRTDIVCEDTPTLEEVPINDFIIDGFSARCSSEKSRRVSSDDDEEEEEDEEEDYEQMIADYSNDAAAAAVTEKAPPGYEVEGKDEATQQTKVFVSNLPFTTNLRNVRRFCEKHGSVDDLSLPTMREGPRFGKPAGYAIVTFTTAAGAAAAANALNGALMDGRELRARLALDPTGDRAVDAATPGSHSGKRKLQSRYFGGGPVNTPQRKRNPCSLCSQTGHMMESCPQQMCNRCFQTGHFQRDCKARRQVKLPELCTACGSSGHSWKWCESTDAEKRLSKKAKCLSCAQRGHLDCALKNGKKQKTYLPPTRDVFCAWCARKGHTEPSCPNRGGRTHHQ